MIVDAQNISVCYGDFTAIENVNFTLPSGTLAVLLGQSGAGKTTLLRALRGQISKYHGIIRMEADAFSSASSISELQRHTGWISQENSLIGRLTCLSNVLIGRVGLRRGWAALGPFRLADRIAALKALEDVGMLDFALRRADTLSGGEQRRIAIARALASGPRLLLGDEITTGLDSNLAAKILRIVRSLCRDHGHTAIISSHDVRSALAVADQVLALRKGRLVLNAAASEVCETTLQDVYRKTCLPLSEVGAH